MSRLRLMCAAGVVVCIFSRLAPAESRVAVERVPAEETGAEFRSARGPGPSRNDAAASAVFRIAGGERDRNSGALEKLHDGRVPGDEDQPAENFFFASGAEGGRVLVDLGHPVRVGQVNSYSWHSGDRAPQVYTLYASDGTAPGFAAEPEAGADPERAGWRRVARVDTRPAEGERGGQYGVSVSGAGGAIGTFRYLLFDVSRTESRDRFGNTFYSEIDVVACDAPEPRAAEVVPGPATRKLVEAADGRYRILLDTTGAPELTGWAARDLAPVMQEWYPKIVAMFPGEGYRAPGKLRIYLVPGLGVPAATEGTYIFASAPWLRDNLQGEAKGALVHELVHVVQPRVPGAAVGAAEMPTWLREGIPDYVRWYGYEPEARGAEIARENAAAAQYDAGYRVSANFLHWVAARHGEGVVPKLHAALREGKYSDGLWETLTGQPLEALAAEWKTALAEGGD